MERDAESYRQFLDEHIEGGPGVVSPYDHFYMKEAVKRGKPEDIAQKIFELQNEHPPRPKAEYEARMAELNKELEDLVINYKRSIDQEFNLSQALENTVDVTIDTDALSTVADRNNHGLRPVDLEMSADLFLDKQRCRAETNLIKARLTYKVYSDCELTKQEKKYLDAWMSAA